MFHGWDEFYLLIGGAAGALIGLLFVVVTLTTDLEQGEVRLGTPVYMTPTVFNFAVVLVVSALALAPGLTRPVVGAILGLIALSGATYSIWAALQLSRRNGPQPTHWSDIWCYGVLPAASHLGLAAAAIMTVAGAAVAAHGVAATLMVTLLLAIRNAWDLVTWLAPRASKASKG